jgi:hypothetical protein
MSAGLPSLSSSEWKGIEKLYTGFQEVRSSLEKRVSKAAEDVFDEVSRVATTYGNSYMIAYTGKAFQLQNVEVWKIKRSGWQRFLDLFRSKRTYANEADIQNIYQQVQQGISERSKALQKLERKNAELTAKAGEKSVRKQITKLQTQLENGKKELKKLKYLGTILETINPQVKARSRAVGEDSTRLHEGMVQQGEEGKAAMAQRRETVPLRQPEVQKGEEGAVLPEAPSRQAVVEREAAEQSIKELLRGIKSGNFRDQIEKIKGALGSVDSYLVPEKIQELCDEVQGSLPSEEFELVFGDVFREYQNLLGKIISEKKPEDIQQTVKQENVLQLLLAMRQKFQIFPEQPQIGMQGEGVETEGAEARIVPEQLVEIGKILDTIDGPIPDDRLAAITDLLTKIENTISLNELMSSLENIKGKFNKDQILKLYLNASKEVREDTGQDTKRARTLDIIQTFWDGVHIALTMGKLATSDKSTAPPLAQAVGLPPPPPPPMPTGVRRPLSSPQEAVSPEEPGAIEKGKSERRLSDIAEELRRVADERARKRETRGAEGEGAAKEEGAITKRINEMISASHLPREIIETGLFKILRIAIKEKKSLRIESAFFTNIPENKDRLISFFVLPDTIINILVRQGYGITDDDQFLKLTTFLDSLSEAGGEEAIAKKLKDLEFLLSLLTQEQPLAILTAIEKEIRQSSERKQTFVGHLKLFTDKPVPVLDETTQLPPGVSLEDARRLQRLGSLPIAFRRSEEYLRSQPLFTEEEETKFFSDLLIYQQAIDDLNGLIPTLKKDSQGDGFVARVYQQKKFTTQFVPSATDRGALLTEVQKFRDTARMQNTLAREWEELQKNKGKLDPTVFASLIAAIDDLTKKIDTAKRYSVENLSRWVSLLHQSVAMARHIPKILYFLVPQDVKLENIEAKAALFKNLVENPALRPFAELMTQNAEQIADHTKTKHVAEEVGRKDWKPQADSSGLERNYRDCIAAINELNPEFFSPLIQHLSILKNRAERGELSFTAFTDLVEKYANAVGLAKAVDANEKLSYQERVSRLKDIKNFCTLDGYMALLTALTLSETSKRSAGKKAYDAIQVTASDLAKAFAGRDSAAWCSGVHPIKLEGSEEQRQFTTFYNSIFEEKPGFDTKIFKSLWDQILLLREQIESNQLTNAEVVNLALKYGKAIEIARSIAKKEIIETLPQTFREQIPTEFFDIDTYVRFLETIETSADTLFSLAGIEKKVEKAPAHVVAPAKEEKKAPVDPWGDVARRSIVIAEAQERRRTEMLRKQGLPVDEDAEEDDWGETDSQQVGGRVSGSVLKNAEPQKSEDQPHLPESKKPGKPVPSSRSTVAVPGRADTRGKPHTPPRPLSRPSEEPGKKEAEAKKEKEPVKEKEEGLAPAVETEEVQQPKREPEKKEPKAEEAIEPAQAKEEDLKDKAFNEKIQEALTTIHEVFRGPKPEQILTAIEGLKKLRETKDLIERRKILAEAKQIVKTCPPPRGTLGSERMTTISESIEEVERLLS